VRDSIKINGALNECRSIYGLRKIVLKITKYMGCLAGRLMIQRFKYLKIEKSKAMGQVKPIISKGKALKD
jgi:hypothetical protein